MAAEFAEAGEDDAFSGAFCVECGAPPALAIIFLRKNRGGGRAPYFYVAQMIGNCFAILVKSESLVISGALRSRAKAAAKQSTYGSLWLALSSAARRVSSTSAGTMAIGS